MGFERREPLLAQHYRYDAIHRLDHGAEHRHRSAVENRRCSRPFGRAPRPVPESGPRVRWTSPRACLDKHPSGRWGDMVPALDGLGGAGRGSGVDGGRAYELAQTFLLEDVGTPASGAAAGEHRELTIALSTRLLQATLVSPSASQR